MEVVLRAVLPVLLLACAAACARPPPPPPPAEPPSDSPQAVQLRFGTIVAIRPLAAGSAEYILREHSGATVVVVQPDVDGLAVGERVMLHEQGRTRIARPP